MAGHGIVFQRRLHFCSQAVEAILISAIQQPARFLSRKVTGSSLQFLYQQSQKLFADRAIKAERPVPERYLTADTEGFRILCERFWLFGSYIESHRK